MRVVPNVGGMVRAGGTAVVGVGTYGSQYVAGNRPDRPLHSPMYQSSETSFLTSTTSPALSCSSSAAAPAKSYRAFTIRPVAGTGVVCVRRIGGGVDVVITSYVSLARLILDVDVTVCDRVLLFVPKLAGDCARL